ncbi:MAG: ChaN family lipoprotein [Phycisphaerales bacterium]|nr:ChaN family lipoprotein [Phycisphaerales bacterium]
MTLHTFIRSCLSAPSGLVNLIALVGLAGLLGLTGCSTPPALAQRVTLNSTSDLVMHGEVTTWDALVARAAAADVVLLGEQHDDALGHTVQLALIEAVVSMTPNAAVAMEMLERDEQMLIHDYRDGVIDVDDFAAATNSTAWAGDGSWVAWYQPIVDVAITHNCPVIAANAPRRYVRHARTDGFESLGAMDTARRSLVVTPNPPLEGHYRQRFMDLMQEHGGDIDPEIADAFFRAQSTWDATMADSVLATTAKGHKPVFLLVGRFHTDHDGGTRQCIERANPNLDVLSISLEPETFDPDAAQDMGPPQADIVILTGP